MINLFDLIKNEEYDKIIKFLKENPNTEINLQDQYNNYFIEYVLDSNNIKLITFILDKDVTLDIIDSNGTSLLYNTIKLNKIEVLKLIIESSKRQIGINILDKKDIRGRTALHYCVIFNNIDAYKIIIDNKGDPYIPNKTGENIFFYCLKYNRNNMILYLFDRYKNFNIKNSNNENILQSAISYSNYTIIDFLLKNNNINLNNQTKQYGITALHMLTGNKQLKYIKKIVDLGADITITDYLGNNVLHYAIEEKDDEIIEYYLNKNLINLNLTNLDGNTPLHLYLITYKDSINSINFKILEKIIKNTNLNIQNHNGNTPLHILSLFNLLEKLYEILVKKELNIFIQNYKGKTVYSSFNNKNRLLELAVNSYYNNLKSEQLIIDWEIKCSLIKENKLNEFDINTNLKKLDKINNEKDCFDKIKNVIIKENRSIPKIKNINFDFKSGIILNDCFFSGFPIDTLFGILWLKKTNPEISLILDYPLSSNFEINEYYNRMGINFGYKLDFINSMILWAYQKIFFPQYFDTVITKTLKEGARVIIIPIGIETSFGAHTNIIFWDVKKKIVERFEPNGKNPPIGFDYNPKLLDLFLSQKLQKIDNEIKYITPENYLPTVGFQIIENLENERCKKIGDPNGYCTVWCIWYCYQKLINLETPSNILVEQLINNIKLEAKSFKNLIRNFSKNISSYRDKYLENINIDINDWILTNYTDKDLDKLEKLILKIL